MVYLLLMHQITGNPTAIHDFILDMVDKNREPAKIIHRQISKIWNQQKLKKVEITNAQYTNVFSSYVEFTTSV